MKFVNVVSGIIVYNCYGVNYNELVTPEIETSVHTDATTVNLFQCSVPLDRNKVSLFRRRVLNDQPLQNEVSLDFCFEALH